MQAGWTFLIPQPGTSLDSHLWIILSDPQADPEKILVVNLTSWRQDKDQACVLEVGDHPFVRHKSCVSYRGAKVVCVARLTQLQEAGFQLQEPVSAELLNRMRESALASVFMAEEHADILIDQKLVDWYS